MTTKELLLVLGAAGAVGGAAALGATIVRDAAAPATTDPSEVMTKILDRLDRIETTGAQAVELAKGAKEGVADLRERLTAIEIERADAARREAAQDPADAPRPGRARVPAPGWKSADAAGGWVERAEIDVAAPGRRVLTLGGDGGNVFESAEFARVAPAVAEEMKGIGNGFRLRALPEEKRWEQAKTDVGISDAQAETLKQAVADRDAAMKEALATEESTSDGGAGTIRIARLDPDKAAAAQSAYRRKVDETLDEGQRAKWREKGYDHAFGRHGGGGSRAVFIQSVVEEHDGAPGSGK